MQEQVWESGWDGHERAQLRRWAQLPFADKLQWLEDAHHMALALQESREAQLEAQREEIGPQESEPQVLARN